MNADPRLARRLRDAGAPPPALQVLVYPPVDAVAYRDRSTYPSYNGCGQDFGLRYEDGFPTGTTTSARTATPPPRTPHRCVPRPWRVCRRPTS